MQEGPPGAEQARLTLYRAGLIPGGSRRHTQIWFSVNGIGAKAATWGRESTGRSERKGSDLK